jgi:hypothetical protein
LTYGRKDEPFVWKMQEDPIELHGCSATNSSSLSFLFPNAFDTMPKLHTILKFHLSHIHSFLSLLLLLLLISNA